MADLGKEHSDFDVLSKNTDLDKMPESSESVVSGTLAISYIIEFGVSELTKYGRQIEYVRLLDEEVLILSCALGIERAQEILTLYAPIAVQVRDEIQIKAILATKVEGIIGVLKCALITKPFKIQVSMKHPEKSKQYTLGIAGEVEGKTIKHTVNSLRALKKMLESDEE